MATALQRAIELGYQKEATLLLANLRKAYRMVVG